MVRATHQDWVWCYVDEITVRRTDAGWIEIDLFYEAGIEYMREHVSAGGDPRRGRGPRLRTGASRSVPGSPRCAAGTPPASSPRTRPRRSRSSPAGAGTPERYGAGTASKDCEPEQFTNQILLAKMSYFESKKEIPSLPVTLPAVWADSLSV